MNISVLFDILQYIFLIYLGFCSFYLFVFAIASFFYRDKNNSKETKLHKFVVLIPAYKEDNVIISTANEALIQDYPSELFDIYVIADSFKPKTIELLNKNEKINCIEVSFKQSTKARSINKALDIISDDYDGVIIIDADNIMDFGFIKKVNKAMSNGDKAIQGHRVAKNLDTSFAILDALSEEINNTIFRKGHVALNISSALIGSGMAFDFNLYKSIMKKIDTFADEDKELELKFILGGNTINFLNNAYVYDEKVNNSKVFVKQRSRWISSQIYYARTNFFKAFYELFAHSNFNFFDKVFQLVLAPRIFLLGVSFIITAISLLFDTRLFIYPWLSIFLTCIFALILSVPKRFYNKQTLVAVLSLPYGFLMMVLALFKIKLGHKRFSPTPHQTSTHIKIEKRRK